MRKSTVRIVAEATAHPVDALLDGKLDVALMCSAPSDRRLQLRPLFEDEMLLLVAPRHRLASRPYVRAADFASENLLIYSSLEESHLYRRVLKPARVRPRQVSHCQLTEAILEMVKAGLGVSVMARWAVAPQIESGAVRAVPVTRHGLCRTWTAARLRQRTAPVYLLEFIEELSREALPARMAQAPRQPVAALYP